MIRQTRKVALSVLLAAIVHIISTASADAVSDQAIAARKPPKSLAEFELFTDLAAQKPANRVLPYGLNTPLFSDHAIKLRFVYVPEGAAGHIS